MTALHDQIGTLGVALARWSERDDTRPQPEIRQAANIAVDAVDELTRRLFALRQRLMTEIHASDDATAARVDALLASRSSEPAEGTHDKHEWCRAASPDASASEPDPPEPAESSRMGASLEPGARMEGLNPQPSDP
jgi:hypothetical protein